MILDIIGKYPTAYVAIIGRSGPVPQGRGRHDGTFLLLEMVLPFVFRDFRLCRRIIYPSAREDILFGLRRYNPEPKKIYCFSWAWESVSPS